MAKRDDVVVATKFLPRTDEEIRQGGNSIKKACEDLKATYPNINWKEGKLLNRASKDDLKKWVERYK